MNVHTAVAAVLYSTRGGPVDDPGPSISIDWSQLIPPTGVTLAALTAVIAYGCWLCRAWLNRGDYPTGHVEQRLMWFCAQCLVPAEEPAGLSGDCRTCGTELSVVGPDGYEVTSWQR